MNTRDIQAFVAVVETGSIVRAAAKLHLTQPGITRRIQSLESVLGMPLLERQSKPLKPTLAGREVYDLGRRVLRSVDDLLSMSEPGDGPAGEMKIGLPPFLSNLALEMPIDRLRERFPRLTLRATAGWSSTLVVDIQKSLLDVAAVLIPDDLPPPDGLNATLLGKLSSAIVASPQLGLPIEGATLLELSRHSWVLNQDGCGLRAGLRRRLDAAQLPFDVAVEAFGTELQLSLVARGMGIGLVTRDLFRRSAYRNALHLVPTPEFQIGIHVWLIHAELPGRLAQPIALLRELLTETLANEALALVETLPNAN